MEVLELGPGMATYSPLVALVARQARPCCSPAIDVWGGLRQQPGHGGLIGVGASCGGPQCAWRSLGPPRQCVNEVVRNLGVTGACQMLSRLRQIPAKPFAAGFASNAGRANDAADGFPAVWGAREPWCVSRAPGSVGDGGVERLGRFGLPVARWPRRRGRVARKHLRPCSRGPRAWVTAAVYFARCEARGRQGRELHGDFVGDFKAEADGVPGRRIGGSRHVRAVTFQPSSKGVASTHEQGPMAGAAHEVLMAAADPRPLAIRAATCQHGFPPTGRRPDVP